MMPIQSPSGLLHGMPVPFQVANALPAKAVPLLILASRPLQPPTLTRPTMTMGSSPAMMTKNCMTSL